MLINPVCYLFIFFKYEVMHDKTKPYQLNKGNKEEEMKHLKGKINVYS